MLNEIMNSINNHFAINPVTNELFGYENNGFTIDNGLIITKNYYIAGQYIAISGSILNNGVYRIKSVTNGIIELEGETKNESFYGVIYSLVVPHEFLMLVDRIKKFAESNAGQASNIVSVSFGIQSQSFGTDANGVRAGWQTVFRNELHKYRRMQPDIIL